MQNILETHTMDKIPVLVLRYCRTPEPDEIFPPFRELVSRNPKLMNFAQIWDIRHWTGMNFDDQWLDQIKWNQDFRNYHCLDSEDLPPFVLLMNPINKLMKLMGQSRGFQAEPLYIGYNCDSAWAIVAPGLSMPTTMRDFFRENTERFGALG